MLIPSLSLRNWYFLYSTHSCWLRLIAVFIACHLSAVGTWIRFVVAYSLYWPGLLKFDYCQSVSSCTRIQFDPLADQLILSFFESYRQPFADEARPIRSLVQQHASSSPSVYPFLLTWTPFYLFFFCQDVLSPAKSAI